MLQQITKIGVIVEDLPQVDTIKADPDDAIFLATAFGGNADYIVSGDHHLLDVGEYKGIQILTPAAFLEILKKK